MSASYCLTRRFFYDIVDGRMEEHRSFFLCSIFDSRQGKRPPYKELNGGGSRAHKDYTGMYRMQAAQLQHDQG